MLDALRRGSTGMVAKALFAILVINGLLTAAFVLTRLRAPAGPSGGDRGPRPSWWVMAAVAAVMARLLDLGTRRLLAGVPTMNGSNA